LVVSTKTPGTRAAADRRRAYPLAAAEQEENLQSGHEGVRTLALGDALRALWRRNVDPLLR